ncbi:putative uncharacterized protein (plasmid) [Bradyrhizobium diazoefficiens]|uniref:Uncharacterized protein n=1 Tax=Bradyrhizobium diazoefficiens TaxID=1355477 RepID=A0A0E4BXD9_9BRAD|nr:putative uncharacterized protein [Bradyrhizobium diazoefficiens]
MEATMATNGHANAEGFMTAQPRRQQLLRAHPAVDPAVCFDQGESLPQRGGSSASSASMASRSAIAAASSASICRRSARTTRS